MNISASMVKELRERTSVGMLDCKNALVETNGDIEKAIDLLREKGLAKAASKSSRVAAEGLVDSYIHGGRIGVIVEVNSETDFVSQTDEFKQFVKDIAMQIAAANPKYVSIEDVSEEDVAREKEVLTQQAMNEGKPQHIAEKMVEGRLGKFFEEICLLEQTFIKDSDKKVKDLLNEQITRTGENLVIRRFSRFEVGEGIEKKEENFADEVAKQMNV